jgi:hypothetical protein
MTNSNQTTEVLLQFSAIQGFLQMGFFKPGKFVPSGFHRESEYTEPSPDSRIIVTHWTTAPSSSGLARGDLLI